MMGQRFRQKSSDHWVDQEKRDPGFNIMSPTGRSRTFKGIHLPRRLETVDSKDPQMPFNNILAGNSSRRDEKEHGKDAREFSIPVMALDKNEVHFGAHGPQSMDGVSFVYTKGPAGQTPFPTPIAMSGYFPQNQQQYAQSQCQSQRRHGSSPYPPLPQTKTQAHAQTSQAPVMYSGPQKIESSTLQETL